MKNVSTTKKPSVKYFVVHSGCVDEDSQDVYPLGVFLTKKEARKAMQESIKLHVSIDGLVVGEDEDPSTYLHGDPKKDNYVSNGYSFWTLKEVAQGGAIG